MNRQKHTAPESLFYRITESFPFRKAAAWMLLFSFAISPFITYAQTTITEPVASSNTTTTEAESPNSQSETPGASTPTDSPAAALTDTPSTETPSVNTGTSPAIEPIPIDAETLAPDTPQPESLLSGGPTSDSTPAEISKKTVDPKFYSEPDVVTGSLSYSYPLSLPPGRNGLTPDLKLTYTSQPSEDINPFGYGWDVSIPYIERINRKGVEKLYTQDYFRSSLDGELFLTSSSTNIWGAKIESGAPNQYQYSGGAYWVLTDKYGAQYKFGTTSAARQDNVASSTQVYRWMLQEVIDTNGNKINYSYVKDQGQIYPYKVNYTSTATTSGAFEIEFLRENRSDIATSTKAGFSIVASQRINEIQAKINSSWVRKYTISYGAGDNAARSLIQSITESGKDEQGNTTTLPATSFGYQRTISKGWTEQQNMHVLQTFGGGTYFSDINGDGLTDITHSYNVTGNLFNKTYLSTGAGWTASSTWDMPVYIIIENQSNEAREAARLVDVNGDGLTDMIAAYDRVFGWEGADTLETYVNNGAGWTASSTWRLPVFFSTSGGGACAEDSAVRLADVNGDGLTDILQSGCSAATEVYYNNGVGWTASNTTIPVDFSDGTQETKSIRLEDVNSDGFIDIIKSYGGTHQTYLNSGGTGWTLTPSWAPPVDFADSNTSDMGVRFADVNGDGLLDLIQGYSNLNESGNKVYLNDGSGWTEDPEWHPAGAFTTSFIPINGDDTIDNHLRFADVNGDGMPDLISAHNTASTSIVYFNNGSKTDVLIQATYPQGGNSTFGYKSSQSYTSGGILLSPQLPLALNTLQSIAMSDGVNAYASTTYSYESGRYYYANPFDRRFSGFSKITKTDPVGNVTKSFYHQGNASDSSHGEYQDDQSKIGQTYRTESYDDANNLYAKTIYQWDKASLGNNRTFVKLTQQTNFAYDGDSDHKERGTTLTYNDTKRQLITNKDWGEVTGSDDGSFTDTGSDIFTTNFAYAASSTGNVLGLLSQSSTTDQGGTKIAEQRLYYDSLSLNSVSKGNQTKDEHWITGSTYASTTRIYSSIGLITSERDGKGNLTTYVYDSNYLYPATTTNALAQSTKRVFDYSSGKIATTTDENNAVFASVYDGLDRVIAVKQPDSATTSSATITKAVYAYGDTVLPSVHQTINLSSATSSEAYFYLDGLGRIMQQRMEAEDNGDYVVKDYKYDSRGLLAQESLPYFGNGLAKKTPTTKKKLYLTYSYDTLARTNGIGTVVGTTSTAYDDWKQTVTDANGNAKDFFYDPFGNLSKVTEHNATTIYDTLYEYDGKGNLTKITDALSNVRNFTYDGLNRQLTSQDLHASGDTLYGTSTYAYDLANNRTQFVNPRNQTVNYTYDKLNRPATEDYTGAAGTEKTYTYDSCLNGVGKLCQINTSSASTTYAYSKTGAVVSEQRNINAPTTYLTLYAYDQAGNLTSIVYPDISNVTYLYNAAGLLEAINQQEHASTTVTQLVTDFDYAPTGAVTYEKNGNGTETFILYDADALYRMTNKKTIGPGMGMMMQGLGAGGESLSELSTSSVKASSTPESENLLSTQSVDSSDTIFLGKEGTGKKAKSIYATRIYARSAGAGKGTANIKTNLGSGIFNLSTGDDTLSLSLADGKANTAAARTTQTDTEGPTSYTFTNALGTGADLEVIPGEGFVQKNIVLHAVPASAVSGADYQATFKLGAVGTSTLDIEVDGQRLSTAGTLESSGEATILANGTAVAYIWPPYAEAATRTGTESQRVPVSIRYEKRADGIYLTKIVPATWLMGASYPVRADFTVSTYPGLGDGIIRTAPYPGSWATQHAATSGTETNYNAFSSQVGVGAYDSPNGYLYITRAFLPFDTSYLPDNAIIGTSTLYIRATSTQNQYADAYSYITVYQSSQHSPTALTDDDIDTCGNTETNPTKGSSDVNVSSFATSSHTGLALNSTGKGWISKTGYTKLCLREGHDATNNAITNSNSSWKEEAVGFSTAEFPGTIYDPYLEIIYTVPNSAPTAPDNLLVLGKTNPTNVATSTPYFSAQFNDSDTADIATSYQIKISTVSNFASSVWNSGKTTLTEQVLTGNQSINIPYGRTALPINGSTYYWIIRFWDDDDVVGAWSSTNQFSMANDGSVLQEFSYTYDPVGNITSVTDHGGLNESQTSNYTYDDLNRLETVSTTPGSSWSYTYDALGNLRTSIETTSGGNSHSLNLDGWNNYAYHADSSAFDITGNITLEAWIKLDTLPSAGAETIIAGKWIVPGGRSYKLGYYNNSPFQLLFTTSGDCSSQTVGSVAYTLATSTWYHIAVSKSGSTATFYVNGSEVGTATVDATLCNSSSEFHVGLPLDGLLDDVRLWNVARTGTEISNNKSTELVGNETGLAAYYKFNNAYSDTTSNGNNLTASNTPNFSANVPFSPGDPVMRVYGYAGTSYANPHAPTSFSDSTATTTYTYDNSGNQLTGGLTNTWNYLNQMTQSGNGVATSTYAYDDAGARVKLAAPSGTSWYPNQYYTVGTSTREKNIYANGQLIASVSNLSGATTTYWTHTDHLNGTDVSSDTTGLAVEDLTYTPYGAPSEDTKTGSFSQSRQYIGQEYDAVNQLSYLNARYYEGSRGQFLSQDPVFLGNPRAQILTNPQSLNSYSYANGNPIVNKDPDGRAAILAPILIGAGVGALGGIGGQALSDYANGSVGSFSTYGVAALSGATVGGSIVVAGTLAAGAALSAGAASLVVGGTAGFVSAGTQLAGDAVLGQETDYGNLVFNSGLNAVTAGTLNFLPKVRGRLPNVGTNAFFTGAHTQRQAAEEFVSGSAGSFARNANNYLVSTSKKYGSVSSSLSAASKALGKGDISGAIKSLQKAYNTLKGR
ncbi:MAG: LamG-like jellyroll fold domain-containing protein [Minisyncoccia bacterium]